MLIQNTQLFSTARQQSTEESVSYSCLNRQI